MASCWELQEHSLTKNMLVVFSRTWYSSNLIEHHPIKQSFTTCSISNFCNLIFYPQSHTHEYRWMWNYCNLNTGEWKQVKYRFLWMKKAIELIFTSDVNSQLLGAPQIGSNEIFSSWILTKFVTLLSALKRVVTGGHHQLGWTINGWNHIWHHQLGCLRLRNNNNNNNNNNYINYLILLYVIIISSIVFLILIITTYNNI